MSRCEPDRITGGTSRQLRRSDHPSPPRPWPDHTCLISRWAPETRPDDGQAGGGGVGSDAMVARNAAALRLRKRRQPLPVCHSGRPLRALARSCREVPGGVREGSESGQSMTLISVGMTEYFTEWAGRTDSNGRISAICMPAPVVAQF